MRVLREADLIACEDTRRTRALLTHFGISTPTARYVELTGGRRAGRFLDLLREGKAVALVTDAGTPAISDPGFWLVRAARAAGVAVVPVPGPSALTAALAIAGIPASPCVFEGFLPIKPGRRRRRLAELRAAGMPVVLFESPHRIAATLEAIREAFGEVELLVGRELTKQFEEIATGPAAAHLARLARAGARGEFTVVIPAGPAAP